MSLSPIMIIDLRRIVKNRREEKKIMLKTQKKKKVQTCYIDLNQSK